MNSTTELEKNASAPAVPQPKPKRTPAKKATAREESRPCQESSQEAKGGPRQQEGRIHRADETLQRRDAGEDHSRGQLARARVARLRQRSCLSGLRANVGTWFVQC